MGASRSNRDHEPRLELYADTRRLVSEYELALSLGQLAQDQIRIFTVGFEKCGDKGTDHIDLHMMFSRPVEGGLCQGRGYAAPAKCLGNFAVKKREHMAGDGVLQGSHVSVALQFEAAGRDQLRSGFFVAKYFHCALRKCSRIACACVRVTTADSAATSACFTACRLPKCSSRRRVVDSPTPAISRNSVVRSRIWRRLRWKVTAKRCASSRIICTRCSTGE